jgi:hypothetical protein
MQPVLPLAARLILSRNDIVKNEKVKQESSFFMKKRRRPCRDAKT